MLSIFCADPQSDIKSVKNKVPIRMLRCFCKVPFSDVHRKPGVVG
jgi:hypothetical protein